MGREFFSPSKSSSKCPRSVSPPKKPSSEPKRRYFLPIIYIDQLRRTIKVMEKEIASNEQQILECKEAIDQRRRKVLEYQERINDVKKQIDGRDCL